MLPLLPRCNALYHCTCFI